MEATYLLRCLMKMFRDKQKDLNMVFIELNKTCDKIPRENLWRVLEKKGVWIEYIQVNKDMYHRAKRCLRLRTCREDWGFFSIIVGLHQESALSITCLP